MILTDLEKRYLHSSPQLWYEYLWYFFPNAPYVCNRKRQTPARVFESTAPTVRRTKLSGRPPANVLLSDADYSYCFSNEQLPGIRALLLGKNV